jgi:hypothetical protein
MGRPFARWAASPCFSVAAPATGPDVPRARIRRCRLPTCSPASSIGRRPQVRYIGLDVHREFCEVAISEDGEVRSAGRIRSRRPELELFAQSLGRDDEVALEATGGAEAIAGILRPRVARVGVVNAKKLRAISEAKAKTDRLDARRLAALGLRGRGVVPRRANEGASALGRAPRPARAPALAGEERDRRRAAAQPARPARRLSPGRREGAPVPSSSCRRTSATPSRAACTRSASSTASSPRSTGRSPRRRWAPRRCAG